MHKLSNKMLIQVSFIIIQRKIGVSKIDNSASPCILFLLDGEVSIDSGEYQNVHIEKDKMVLIPQHVDNKIEVIYDAKCLLLFWNKDIRCVTKYI